MTACGRTLVLLNRDGDRFSLDLAGFCLHCLGSRFYSRSLAPCDRPVLHLRTVSAAARGRPGVAALPRSSPMVLSPLSERSHCSRFAPAYMPTVWRVISRTGELEARPLTDGLIAVRPAVSCSSRGSPRAPLRLSGESGSVTNNATHTRLASETRIKRLTGRRIRLVRALDRSPRWRRR